MTATDSDLNKRLTFLKREVLARGFDRHPSILQSTADLPAELKSPAVTRLAESEPIQKIIFFPQQIQRGWNYVPKQALIFTNSDVIHLIASIWPDEEPRVTRLGKADLMYLKVTLILLYGFLEIIATGQDLPVQLGVEFNAVYWDIFAPSLRKLLTTRNISSPTAETEFIITPSLQERIDGLPLKFSNGLRIHGMLPGENLEEIVFQPGVWKRRLLFFRKQVTADTIILLTSNFMVILQEEVGVKQGWIISYLRRDSIQGIREQPHELWNELTIKLERSDQTADYVFLLPIDAARKWRDVWEKHGGSWQENLVTIKPQP
jgi:hypothetical protein